MTSTTAAPPEQRVITPTVGRVARRGLYWVGAAVVILIVGIVTFALAGPSVGGQPLSSTNPAPGGAMAVAEVLRTQGVTVTATSTLNDTVWAIDDPAETTLLIYDLDGYLSTEQLTRAVGLADRVVLVDPGFEALRAVAPTVAQAGYAEPDPIDADCDVTAVQKAESVSGGESAFRIIDEDTSTVGCLDVGDEAYLLVQLDDGRLSILGATGALTNELVVNDGNAAFALNLLGADRELVWYLPSVEDLPVDSNTIAELTPVWLTPVLFLVALTAVAATIWRGRRFGPLVVENLPVTVRASETMLGRARLYERSSSRLRALDALRIGSVQRLASLCGLPRTATVDEVIVSVAAATGQPIASIRTLLVDADPATDSDLMTLSDALLTLENDVARAVRP